MSWSEHNAAEFERRLNEVIADYLREVETGKVLDRGEWLARHPEFAAELSSFFGDQDEMNRLVPSLEQVRAPEAEQLPGSSPRLKPAKAQRDGLGIGSVFAGEYRIFGVKHGGMGCVYFADVLPRRRGDALGKVAIKTVPDFEAWQELQEQKGAPSGRSHYDQVARHFRHEAEAWVRLGKHDHILWAFCVIDIGGKPYLIMEYADQGDLRDWITNQRLTTALAVNLAIQFCDGMVHATQTVGLVHRDIKPANILLTRDYLLRIADFGLSRAYNLTATSRRKVGSAFAPFGGTLGYMAPEQLTGASDGDTRSDVFSFGVTLFEMLTCHRLFPGEDLAMHLALRRTELPFVHDLVEGVTSALSAIVARCIAYEAKDRYDSFSDLLKDLNSVHEVLPNRLPFPVDGARFSSDRQIVQECYSLIALGQFARAAERADDGIKTSPDNADHWINKGKALSQLGNHDSAHQCYLRATRLQPANALAWANLSFSLQLQGNLSLALNAAGSALRLDDSLYEAWHCQGECLLRMHRIHNAIDSLTRAISLRPHDWRAYPSLACALGQQTRYHEAASILRQAVTIIPDNAELWLLLAVSLSVQLGDLLEAREAVDRAIELAPGLSDAWAIRASILWKAEGPSAAIRQQLDRCLALNPHNPRGLNLLASLNSVMSQFS